MVEKELMRQQAEEQVLLGGALVVSEDTQEEFHPLPVPSTPTLEEPTPSASSSSSSNPVDIHGFMTEFINKNFGKTWLFGLRKQVLLVSRELIFHFKVFTFLPNLCFKEESKKVINR